MASFRSSLPPLPLPLSPGTGSVSPAAAPGGWGVFDADCFLVADRRGDGEKFSIGWDGGGIHGIFFSRHDFDDSAVHGDFFDDLDH